MILYLDTSALVKAYIEETSSTIVLNAIKAAKVASTHMLAFVEAHATFSRIKRENKLTEDEYDIIKNSFNEDWANYLHVDTTDTLIERAADLAEAFALRAYDSVHLAAADILYKQSHQPTLFGCFDKQLNKAAHVLGLKLLS